MKIDVHAHCFIPDSVAFRAMAMMTSSVKGIIEPNGDGTLKNLLDTMQRDGIDVSFMLPIATKPSHHEVILQNALALMDGSLDERSPRMIVPFASAHPLDPKLDAHLDEISSHGIKGIKFHPYYQNFSLDDPSVWPMFRKIADLGLVVQCHCGFDIGYPDRFDACGPKEVATLLKNVKGLKFIAAHLGGCAGYEPHATDELIDLGCYADTSALERDHGKPEQQRVLREWPREQLLFGTDFPWTSPVRSAAWVESIRPTEDLECVFSANAKHLLQLA
ncbi:MAG: hypothetical protein E7049_02330 [Lentisphaerae bacterium]|nr:hypothetical protein [Lentisphaerota bacterium]